MKHLRVLLLIFLSSTLYTERINNSIIFGGYIKNESFWDSRQVVGVGDDQVLLYPEKKEFDELGNDINAKGQFNTVPIESKLWLKIKGPQIRNATSGAYIDANFFGSLAQLTHIEILNIVHLRNAIFKLMWKDVDLSIGQFWHPIYVIGCEPRTIGFNTGAPIESYSRNPQVCFDYKMKSTVLKFVAATELDFTSDGPIGSSSTYMRNAVVPDLATRLDFHVDKHFFGVAFDFKRIRPRIETDLGFKADEAINSMTAMAFAALNWEHISINNKITFAQNGTNLSVIGGYAVHSIDPETDHRTYTNINAISFWTDWQFRLTKPVQPGLFFGIIKNLGARETILQNVTDENGAIVDQRIYGFGTDLSYVLRASGRIAWHIKDFKFGAELEYTRSPYGTIDDCGKVRNSVPVGNTRFMISLFYYI